MTLRQSKYAGWLIHAMVWAVVIFMPLFGTYPDKPVMTGPEYVRFLLVPISFMVVFYTNYTLFISRFLRERRIALFIIVNVLLIAAVMTVVHLFFRYVLPPDINRPPRIRPVVDTIMFFARNAVMYILVVGASVAVRMTSGWYRTEAARKDLEHRQAEAELQNLRSQVNPHFLFNTLNNIYTLIQIDSSRAQKAVHDLSNLLRYVLYGGSRPEVPLCEETAFIREYVELMKLRLPPSVKVDVKLPESSGTMIAPLLFISLIENAFKHGTGNDAPSFVRICIKEENGQVKCETENSYFPKSQVSDRSGSGIGLTNLSRRLEMIYPGRYVFNYGKNGDVYRASLVITI